MKYFDKKISDSLSGVIAIVFFNSINVYVKPNSYDKIYLPFYKKLMIRGKLHEYNTAVNNILNWEVETIGK